MVLEVHGHSKIKTIVLDLKPIKLEVRLQTLFSGCENAIFNTQVGRTNVITSTYLSRSKSETPRYFGFLFLSIPEHEGNTSNSEGKKGAFHHNSKMRYLSPNFKTSSVDHFCLPQAESLTSALILTSKE